MTAGGASHNAVRADNYVDVKVGINFQGAEYRKIKHIHECTLVKRIGILRRRNFKMSGAVDNRFCRRKVKVLSIDYALDQSVMKQLHNRCSNAADGKAHLVVLFRHVLFEAADNRQRSTTCSGLERKAVFEIRTVSDKPRCIVGHHQLFGIIRVTDFLAGYFCRISNFIHNRNNIDIDCLNSRREIRKGHQRVRNDNHLIRILRVDHRIRKNTAIRLTALSARISHAVRTGRSDKRNINMNITGFYCSHPSTVASNVHHIVEKSVRNCFADFTAYTAR